MNDCALTIAILINISHTYKLHLSCRHCRQIEHGSQLCFLTDKTIIIVHHGLNHWPVPRDFPQHFIELQHFKMNCCYKHPCTCKQLTLSSPKPDLSMLQM